MSWLRPPVTDMRPVLGLDGREVWVPVPQTAAEHPANTVYLGLAALALGALAWLSPEPVNPLELEVRRLHRKLRRARRRLMEREDSRTGVGEGKSAE